MKGESGGPAIDAYSHYIERQRALSAVYKRMEALNMKSKTLFDFCVLAGSQKEDTHIITKFPETGSESQPSYFEGLLDMMFPSNGVKEASTKSLVNEFHFFMIKDALGNQKYGVCADIQSENGEWANFTSCPLPDMDSFRICMLSSTPQVTLLMRLIECIAMLARKQISVPILDHESDSMLTSPVFSFLKSIYDTADNSKIILPSVLNVKPAPYSLDPLQFSIPGFAIFFTKLSCKNVISIYSALLLEESVIVTGKSLYEVSAVVISFQTLLSPFPISITYLPILPDIAKYRELLDSPVPFIFGFVGQLPSEIQATIVDLDNNSVTRLSNTMVPNADVLEEELRTVLSNISKDVSRVNYKSKLSREIEPVATDYTSKRKYHFEFQFRHIVAISLVFRNSIDFCFGEKINMCFVQDLNIKDQGKVFMAEIFKNLYEQSGSNFISELVETQAFQMYVTNCII